MSIRASSLILFLIALAAYPARGAGETENAPSATALLQQQAKQLRPLVKSPAVGAFLSATADLPRIAPRRILRNKPAGRAYTLEEAAGLSEAEQAACTLQDCDETFYYFTGYGSPLIYARPLDLWAQAADLTSFSRRRIFDFGYGSIGHLRLLAANGADAVGVEVEPVFRALYSQPGDQGEVPAAVGPPGNVTLLHGRFPGDADVRKAAGGGYDLVISKNVLKRGYIHPEREADERLLVKLGVEDEAFVRVLYDLLNPGGYMLVYNICPAQSPPDQPFIPWADGRFPFERELVERAGFKVLAWDRDDSAAIHDLWFALGYEEGQTREDLSKNLFAHYTLLRRPL